MVVTELKDGACSLQNVSRRLVTREWFIEVSIAVALLVHSY